MNGLLVVVALLGVDYGELNPAFVGQCKQNGRLAAPVIAANLNEAKRTKRQEDIDYWTEQQKLLRSGKLLVAPAFGWNNSKVGQYGRFSKVEVFQVIDGQNALVRLNGFSPGVEILYWVKTDTTGWLEEKGLEDMRTFKLSGTKRYETRFGSKTVLYAERVTDKDPTGDFRFF